MKINQSVLDAIVGIRNIVQDATGTKTEMATNTLTSPDSLESGKTIHYSDAVQAFDKVENVMKFDKKVTLFGRINGRMTDRTHEFKHQAVADEFHIKCSYFIGI